MTFEQFIKQEIGYECKTTFWMDFSIADRFGIAAVKDTFKRAFKEWRTNVVYLTELVLVLNHKMWQPTERMKDSRSSTTTFGMRPTPGRSTTSKATTWTTTGAPWIKFFSFS